MVAPAIEIHDVSKSFKLYQDKPQSAKERVIKAGRTPWEPFHALSNISFDVAPGETVGLLGHNGSGKSTLLKCISGTLRPNTGRIVTRGRLAALLELGAGFHPDLTGRENVYMNGSILGFSKAQIDAIFDDVVDFAELHEFIDQQVKHYSSGMYARLGFAVAINVEPEVLLVDEVLAVGDEAFQRKCLQRIKALQQEGRTILLVSHAMDTVRQIANRAIVFDHGRMMTDAAPGDAVRVFRDTLAQRGVHIEVSDEPPPVAIDPETGELPAIDGTAGLTTDTRAKVRISNIEVRYPNPEANYLLPGEPMALAIDYDASGLIADVALGVEVYDMAGNRLMGITTDTLEQPLHAVKGEGTVILHFEQVPLMDGTYQLNVVLHSRDGGQVYDRHDGTDHFSVMNPTRNRGLVNFPIKVEHLFNF